MGWDSIRWDQNQLETSIGKGFLSQFPFVNLSLVNEFWDWMLLTLVKSPIIACNCILRYFPELLYLYFKTCSWQSSPVQLEESKKSISDQYPPQRWINNSQYPISIYISIYVLYFTIQISSSNVLSLAQIPPSPPTWKQCRKIFENWSINNL